MFAVLQMIGAMREPWLPGAPDFEGYGGRDV